ncbi:MAG: Holliday junction branch migration protein RuvA [Eubacterium sp.]|nr:Holliday junction branch migration protein RuvA [Eubacterium sp.]
MIHFVKGRLDTVSENMVVVENSGIGFEIMVPLSVVSSLPQTGNEVKIYTYTYVREDALQLYGFLTRDELSMFRLLITVSGIGPKGALGILSVMDADALRFAILADDAKSISKAPGIGAKTASKLILELKDKMDFEEAVTHVLDQGQAEAAGGVSDGGMAANDAIQALVALGYTSTEAVRAVKKVEIMADMTVEDILKAGLKNL